MCCRRFIKDLQEQDQTISFNEQLGGPDYDREDFDAFLTDFRKVAMSDNEPIYLTKVLVTVGKFASDDLRKGLTVLRGELLPLLENKVAQMTFTYKKDGNNIVLTPEEILDSLVNGDVFHVDPAHTGTASDLRGMNPLEYLWPTVHFFVLPVLRGCVWLFKAIHKDGLLELSDYPAGCGRDS